jgi:hypothetical protein
VLSSVEITGLIITMLYNERHPFDLKKKRDGFKKEKLKTQKQKTQPRLGFFNLRFFDLQKKRLFA